MSCKHKINLPLFVSCDLPKLESIFLRRHIRNCESCQAELKILKKSTVVLQSAIEKKKMSIKGDEIWQQIQTQLPVSESIKTTKFTGVKWKEILFGKPAYVAIGFAAIILVILVGFWQNKNQQTEMVAKVLDAQTQSYPIIEKINNPNVTVMTYLTDDPRIKIVWLFED